MKRARTVPLPPIRLRAEVAPTDIVQRRAKAKVYTGATLDRYDWFDGAYTLQLAMDGADLSRFNSGAPVTRNHSADLDDVVGVTERAWIADGTAFAMLRFSDREDVASLWADIQNGIVKNVSMDVALQEIRDITKRGEPKALLATRWQPVGLALVPAGADPGAQMAALSNGTTHSCVVHGGLMDENTATPENERNAEQSARLELREMKRRRRIQELATDYALGDVWAQRHLNAGSSTDEAIDDVRRLQAAASPDIDGRIRVTETWDRGPRKLERLATGIASKLRGVEPPEKSRAFAGYTFADAAREVLKDSGRMPMLPPRDEWPLIRLALTTSDFPAIAANVAHQILLPAYEAATPTYRLIARRQNLQDYKPTSILKAGDWPAPLQVGEGGEIQLGAISESKETATLFSYGRILKLTRQLLVNDGTNALMRVLGEYPRRIADLENSLFWTMWASGTASNGPTMADGSQFFATGHSNLAGAGAVIDVTSIAAGVAGMRKQTSLDGIKINAAPRFLLTSPDKEGLARQYCAVITPVQASMVNPFGGAIEPIADANLTGNPWFLVADPATFAAYVWGSLESEPGPRVMSRAGFETEGLEVRVAVDWYTAAVEHRAAWRNPGA